MIQLCDKDSSAKLGTISEEDLKLLIDTLTEEDDDDRDYYINRTTFEVLQMNGASPALMDILKPIFAQREEVEIEWSRE